MTYYAGLDVSLRSTHICVIDDEGVLLAEGKTDSEVADIIAFLDEFNVEITEVGLETGTLTQYLTYGLQFAGYEVICMAARQCSGDILLFIKKQNVPVISAAGPLPA